MKALFKNRAGFVRMFAVPDPPPRKYTFWEAKPVTPSNDPNPEMRHFQVQVEEHEFYWVGTKNRLQLYEEEL